jgi:putative FmdB family regulatory protein
MPLFDYRCDQCGTVHQDLLVKHHTQFYAPRCPTCGKIGLEKLPSAPSFKVSGFNAKNGYSGEK